MVSTRELASLCVVAYGNQPAPAGWSSVETFAALSGFAATLFQKPDTGEFTLAIRGTEPSDLGDLISDALIAIREKPAQVRDAREALKKARGRVGSRPFYLTGHSLGGGLAVLMGAENPDLPVVTFNAPVMTDIAAQPVELQWFGLSGLLTHLLRNLVVVAWQSPDLRMLHVRTVYDPVSLSPLWGDVHNPGRLVHVGVNSTTCPAPSSWNGRKFDLIRYEIDGARFLLCNHLMATVVDALDNLANLPLFHDDLRWLSPMPMP